MMSLNANRRQKGRPNTSASSSNRNNRSRGGGYEKNIVADGIYANSRFSHLLGSLVGCVVQLQVKNGGIYDGILKTNSPKMDVVLEMAHKREDNGNNNQNAINTTPSKDRLIEKVIFSMTDILSITALDVDLDYAVKDSFTDTAISKCNSNHTDAEMKVLQPWEGGEGDDLGGLEKDSSNGWDANDMFRTNEVKFNVQSKYDEALTQYTLPLEKKDTKEFKSREEEATRLANEIEKSDQYKHHIALENGDGDEEEKFSAVKRTSENNATNMQSSSGGSNTGKYIPPNRRTVTGNRNTSRSNFHNHNLPNQRSGNQIPPRLQNQHHHQSHHTNYTHHQPPPNHPPPHQTLDEPRRIPHQMSEEPRRLSHQTSDEPRRLPHQISDEPRRLPHQTSEEPRLNGTAEKEEGERRLDDRKLEEKDKKQEERDKKQEERKIDSDSTCRSSPKQEPVNQTSEKPDLQQTSPGNKGENRRSSSAKGREDIIHELKSFNKNFKLESKVEESVKEATENKQTVVPVDVPTAEEQIVTETPITEETVKTDVTDLVKNSILNPEVKEFIPKFQMNKPPQVPTPPRPQTQNPVNPGIIRQQISQTMPHPYLPSYTVMPPAVVNQMNKPPQVPTPPWPRTQSPVNPGIIRLQISQTMPHPYLPSYTVMPPAVVNQPQQQSSPQPFKVKRVSPDEEEIKPTSSYGKWSILENTAFLYRSRSDMFSGFLPQKPSMRNLVKTRRYNPHIWNKEFEGYLHYCVTDGKKEHDQSWKHIWAELKDHAFYLFKVDKRSPTCLISIRDCIVDIARHHTKKNVFGLKTINNIEYLFQARNNNYMASWMCALQINSKYCAFDRCHDSCDSELYDLFSEKDYGKSPSLRFLDSDSNWTSSSSSSKTRKNNEIFGVQLEDCLSSPNNDYVPVIVDLCTRIIEAKGLKSTLGYRLRNRKGARVMVHEVFQKGIHKIDVDNKNWGDVNMICSVLLLFFEQLQDPVCTSDLYDDFIETWQTSDGKLRMLKVKGLLHQLPEHHFQTFKHIARHLHTVASFRYVNEMSTTQLGEVFGPVLIRSFTLNYRINPGYEESEIVKNIILHNDWYFKSWNIDSYIPMPKASTDYEVQNEPSVSNIGFDEEETPVSVKDIVSSTLQAAIKKMQKTSSPEIISVSNPSFVRERMFEKMDELEIKKSKKISQTKPISSDPDLDICIPKIQ